MKPICIITKTVPIPSEVFMANNSEVYEAIDAATEALEKLQSARKRLKSAERWGVFDIMGGGFFSTLIKRRKMLNAQRDMDEARIALENFRDQLDDVFDLDLKLDDFLSFSDYFFEGLVFADVVVQGRISEAISKVDRNIRVIEKIKKQLQDLLNE